MYIHVCIYIYIYTHTHRYSLCSSSSHLHVHAYAPQHVRLRVHALQPRTFVRSRYLIVSSCRCDMATYYSGLAFFLTLHVSMLSLSCQGHKQIIIIQHTHITTNTSNHNI